MCAAAVVFVRPFRAPATWLSNHRTLKTYTTSVVIFKMEQSGLLYHYSLILVLTYVILGSVAYFGTPSREVLLLCSFVAGTRILAKVQQ